MRNVTGRWLKACHDFIFVINRDDKVEYVNNYAANAIHVPVDEIIGKPRSKLFPAEVSIGQYKAIQQVLDTGDPHYNENYIPVGKQKIWLGTWLVPMRDKEGKNISVMGVSRILLTGSRQRKNYRPPSARKRNWAN